MSIRILTVSILILILSIYPSDRRDHLYPVETTLYEMLSARYAFVSDMRPEERVEELWSGWS